jgi:hypothetical protein
LYRSWVGGQSAAERVEKGRPSLRNWTTLKNYLKGCRRADIAVGGGMGRLESGKVGIEKSIVEKGISGRGSQQPSHDPTSREMLC